MKKIMLVAVMAVFCFGSGNAQSIMVQKVDSVQTAKIELIETNLTHYYKQNRTSQVMLFVGSALMAVGILVNPDPKEPNLANIAGGAASLLGGIVYLDSFKWLNLKPKKVHEHIYKK